MYVWEIDKYVWIGIGKYKKKVHTTLGRVLEITLLFCLGNDFAKIIIISGGKFGFIN